MKKEPLRTSSSLTSSSLRGVLFDLDGVLIDSEKAWFNVVCQGREFFGYPPITWQEFSATFGQGVEADRDSFFPEQEEEHIDAYYGSVFADQIPTIEVMPMAQEVLQVLSHRGLSLAVVTNTPWPLARRILQDKEMLHLFDAVAGSGEAPEKPAPDLIHLALQRLGLENDEVIYVGDSASDTGATRAANTRLVGMNMEGDWRVASLQELLPIVYELAGDLTD